MARSEASAPDTVLLTGFEPFGGRAFNTSAQVVERLRRTRLPGCRLVTACLPTTFSGGIAALEALVDAHRPRLVVCIGEAGGLRAIALERVAVNLADARIPDNAGERPVDQPIVPDGPAAHFTALPVRAMRDAMRAAGVPAELSLSAGTFVCNHVFYGLMHRIATRRGWRRVRGGFVHVPGLPAVDGAPAFERVAEGLRIALKVAAAGLTPGRPPARPAARAAARR